MGDAAALPLVACSVGTNASKEIDRLPDQDPRTGAAPPLGRTSASAGSAAPATQPGSPTDPRNANETRPAPAGGSAPASLWLDAGLLAVALLLATVLTWRAFVEPCLAIDEHVSFWIADRSSPSDLLTRSFRYSATPPLSFLLQRACLDLLGPREWVLRLPATACYYATLVTVWWIGRRRFGRLTGGVASVVLATYPSVLDVSVAGRPYSVGLLLATLALVCTQRIVEQPASRLRWVAWVLINVLLAHTHYLFAPLGLAEVVWLTWSRRAGGPAWRQVLGWGAVVVAGSLTTLPGLVTVWNRKDFLNWTTRPPHVTDLVDLVLPIDWSGFPLAEWWTSRPLWWIVLGLPLLWLLGRRRHLRDWLDTDHWSRAGRFILLAAIWFALPAVALWGLGRFWLESLAAERYLVVSLPGAALALAGVLCTLRGRGAPILAVVALLLVEGIPERVRDTAPPPGGSIPGFTSTPRRLADPADAAWQDAAQVVASHSDGGGLVLVASGLTEMRLVFDRPHDPVFHDYVCCRLGRMYLSRGYANGEHRRLTLPMPWTAETQVVYDPLYRSAIAAAQRGTVGPAGIDLSNTNGDIWLVAGADHDLLRATAERAHALLTAAGAVERFRFERDTVIAIKYSSR